MKNEQHSAQPQLQSTPNERAAAMAYLQKISAQTPNERAMAYLQNLADLYLADKSKSSFLHGLAIGAAQAMMIAGVITADQSRQIEDQTW